MKRILLILCLLGAGFCLSGYLGLSESICLSSGCALYADARLFGLPIYLLGAGAYAALGALLLLAGTGLFRAAILLGVAADAVFLAVLLLTATCTNCLLAGLLFFAILALGLAMKPRAGMTFRFLAGLAGVAWLILFTANLGVMVQGTMGPEPMHGRLDAPVKIFFSPTCPACIVAVNQALDTLPKDDLALFPVAKNNEDEIRFLAMADALAQGKGPAEAVAAGLAPEAGNSTRAATLDERLMLLKNKTYLLRQGATGVPVVISDRLLKAKPPAPAPAPVPEASGGYTPMWNGTNLENILPAQDSPEGCGFADEDCGSGWEK